MVGKFRVDFSSLDIVVANCSGNYLWILQKVSVLGMTSLHLIVTIAIFVFSQRRIDGFQSRGFVGGSCDRLQSAPIVRHFLEKGV